MDKQPRKTKAQRSSETRALLIGIALKLFAENGYAATATDAILQQADLTRGALYHQFQDKSDLFLAVCRQMQSEVAGAIEHAARKAGTPFEALVCGCRAFLETVSRPDYQRVLIIDAPSVLGSTQWADLDREYGYSLLQTGIQEAVDSGEIDARDAEALAVALNGAMNDLAVWIAGGDDQRLDRATDMVFAILVSFRSRKSG